MFFPILFVAILLLYSYLVLSLWHAWKKIPVFQRIEEGTAGIAVIIPARNEEQSIPGLLQALHDQNYRGKYEVIVVDDQSTDRTAERVQSFPFVKLVSLSGSGTKKQAIATGIEHATGELILTTDADCLPTRDWLSNVASFYKEEEPAALAAPVLIEPDGSLLSVFQSLDFMMLQGITAATVNENRLSMANGANLAYTKAAFESVQGFEGIDGYASGDDMFLVYKIQQQFPGRYRYLLSREAIVRTKPAAGPRAFLRQRQRWASKSFGYHDKRILPVLILVYFANLAILSSFVLAFIFPFYWFYVGLGLFIKTISEWPLMRSVTTFFSQRRLMVFFPLLQPLHVVYTIVVGVLSLFPRYRWKGRTLK